MVISMGWRWGWGRGGWGWSIWPGKGPFSHLPPWMRPGWVFGRGMCWRFFGNPWLYSYSYYPFWYYPGYYWGYPAYYPPYWW